MYRLLVKHTCKTYVSSSNFHDTMEATHLSMSFFSKTSYSRKKESDIASLNSIRMQSVTDWKCVSQYQGSFRHNCRPTYAWSSLSINYIQLINTELIQKNGAEQNLTVSQVLKKFSVFYGNWKLIIFSATACY